MIIISNIFINKFLYNNNINKTIYVNRTSETINKLIQYDLNSKSDDIFNIIHIEFIFLIIDINELALLKNVKIKQSDFNLLQSYTYTGINEKYDKINLYTIFEKLYSCTNMYCTQYWLVGSKENIYHRENDLPASICNNGTKSWYKNGKLHRDNDLPAVIHSNEFKQWYKNGFLHRDNDLPAIIYENSDKYWYKNGSIHRDNDLPAIIFKNGDIHWYKNGIRHRDNDLPASIYTDGAKYWFKNGINWKTIFYTI